MSQTGNIKSPNELSNGFFDSVPAFIAVEASAVVRIKAVRLQFQIRVVKDIQYRLRAILFFNHVWFG